MLIISLDSFIIELSMINTYFRLFSGFIVNKDVVRAVPTLIRCFSVLLKDFVYVRGNRIVVI